MEKPEFDPSKSFEIVKDSKPAFDSSKPFTIAEEKPLVTIKGIGKGLVEQLPFAGALFGGTIGLSGGPIGGIAGAGLGAGLGQTLKNKANEYFFDQPITRKDIYEGIPDQMLMGMSGEGAGQLIGKGLQVGSKGIANFLGSAKKFNAPEIIQATEALGAKATSGQIFNDPAIQGLESSLEQSPSIAGSLMRKKTGPLREAVASAPEKVFADIPSRQLSDVGSEFKNGLRINIDDKLAPLKKAFEGVKTSTKFIDVDPTSLERVSNNIRRSEKFESSTGFSIVNKIADDVTKIKSVDDLKLLATNIQKMTNSPSLDGAAKSALGDSLGRLRALEENTIIREAIKQGRNATEGSQAAFELLGDLRVARQGYRELMLELKDLGKGSGIDKNVKSISNFLNRVDDIPDEKVVDTFFKTGNRKALVRLQEIDPTGFESLRIAKLDKIRASSELGGKTDPVKLLKNVQSLEPDTIQLLFGDKAQNVLENLRTVQNSIPKKIGPSGTPQGLEFGNYLNPMHLLVVEPSKFAQLAFLKLKTSGIVKPMVDENAKAFGSLLGQSIFTKDSSAIDRRMKQIKPTGSEQ